MIKRKRVLCLILARGGSKGVKNKNIKNLNGHPVISYAIKAAKGSKYIDRIVLSSDDKKIINIALNYNIDAPFVRPPKLAKDNSNVNEAFIHALDWIEKEENKKYDYIIQIQCTNPMVLPKDIDAVISKLHSTGADSVISVNKVENYHPARLKKIINDKICDFSIKEIPFTNRQKLKPDAFIRNGSIYSCKRNKILVRVGSKNSRPYIMPPERSINIDTPIDFTLAEIMMNRNFKGSL